MSSCQDATIKGFNDFLAQQKDVPGEVLLTLVQFDDEYEIVYSNTKLQDAPLLDSKAFQPRGTTALLDAMGKTIVKLGEQLDAMAEDERPSKVIMAILTDGYENASKEYNSNQVFDLIKKYEADKGWSFVFIGANQDAIASAAQYGISGNSSMSYTSDDKGTQHMYKCFSQAVACCRSGGELNLSQYNKENEI
jgi:hypothetical protein